MLHLQTHKLSFHGLITLYVLACRGLPLIASLCPRVPADPDLADEVLMAALGIQVDQEIVAMQQQGVAPEVMAKWAAEERRRSAQQWRPLHTAAPPTLPGAFQSQQAMGGAATSIPTSIPASAPTSTSTSAPASGLAFTLQALKGRKPAAAVAASTSKPATAAGAALPMQGTAAGANVLPATVSQTQAHGSDSGAGDGDAEDVDVDVQATWSNVEPYLFDCITGAARLRLVFGILELLGAPLGHWCCSNAATAAQNLLLAPNCGLSLSEILQTVSQAPVCGGAGSAAEVAPGGSGLALNLGQGAAPAPSSSVASDAFAREFPSSWQCAPWYSSSEERRAFLSRLLLHLADGPFSMDVHVCTAYLVVEATVMEATAVEARTSEGGAAGTAGDASDDSRGRRPNWDRARTAARAVLARSQDSVVMWHAYAQLEAAAGQVKTARKVR